MGACQGLATDASRTRTGRVRRRSVSRAVDWERRRERSVEREAASPRTSPASAGAPARPSAVAARTSSFQSQFFSLNAGLGRAASASHAQSSASLSSPRHGTQPRPASSPPPAICAPSSSCAALSSSTRPPTRGSSASPGGAAPREPASHRAPGAAARASGTATPRSSAERSGGLTSSKPPASRAAPNRHARRASSATAALSSVEGGAGVVRVQAGRMPRSTTKPISSGPTRPAASRSAIRTTQRSASATALCPPALSGALERAAVAARMAVSRGGAPSGRASSSARECRSSSCGI